MLDCAENWAFENKSQDIEVKVEGALDVEALSSTNPDTVVLGNAEVSTAYVTVLEKAEVSSKALDKDAKTGSEDKKEKFSGNPPLRAIVQMIEEKDY